MEIQEVKYTKRFNIGDYQHEEYTVTANAEEGATKAFAALKEAVAKAHAGDVVEKAKVSRAGKAKEAKEEETEEVEEAPKAVKAKAVKTAAKVVEPEEEEETEEAEEEETEEAPKAVKGKAVKKKGSEYNRNLDLHKKLFVEVLNDNLGDGWVKKNAGRAKTVSIKMEGKSFMDADGEVVAEFIKEAIKLAKAKA